MAVHRVSQVLGGTMLALGMAVASWGNATPHPAPWPSQSGAYLGVMVDKVSPETAAAQHVASGATMIANVDQDGPACHAGLKGGDVVTAFNGKKVSGPEQFADLIHDSAPGSTVTLTVVRNGHSQDMKVKLGDWKQMAAMPPQPPTPPQPLSPAGTMPPMLAMPAMPAIDVPGYSPLLAHSGVLVEPLSPQLCDFFGVPQNEGVLVRSVDKGSPGANAGLKAGDVIVRVNDETIHDMQDWKRALKKQGGKVSLSIVRDKRPQTLQMTVPANTSELNGPEWQRFEPDMQAFSAEMEKLRPEIEKNAQEMAKLGQLDQQQIDDINRQAKEAAKTITPEMKKQAKEMSKQAEQLRKEMEKMRPEMERAAREMAESMTPTAKQWSDMAREVQKSMKDLQPELQKQMEELQKEWQQKMREWQQNFKGSNPKQL